MPPSAPLSKQSAQAAMAALRAQGFREVVMWTDGPGTTYPQHEHAGVTAHIVLAGEITITTSGASRTYHAGERFVTPKACSPHDVAAGERHAAVAGAEGRTYVLGEKP